ncbi:unnamed protein product [Caenorhabditis nigoni]
MRNELISYLKKPKNEFKDLPKSNDTHSITCIHIRRTDFVGSGFHSPDKYFILSAMKFVEETEKQRRNLNMTFVFFGDDLKFMEDLLGEEYVLRDGTKRNLKNESYISKDDPQDTILYSSSNCDVVLFTAPHSTFGWWLGYLSKGNQVYYTDIRVVADVSVVLSYTTTVKIMFCILLVYLVFLLNNWRKKEDSMISTTIQAIPSFLPIFNNITLPIIPLINEQPKKPTVPELPKKYLSTNLASNARLGNHLFEMASFYAISKKLERIPTFFIDTEWHDTMLQDTDFLIPGLIDHFLIVNDTIPKNLSHTSFSPQCCIFDDPNRLKNITDEYLHLSGAFYQRIFHFCRTCIHIRRTDFVGTGFHVPEKDFILSAMKFVEEKENNLLNMNYTTVFFTDDAGYVKTLLSEKFELKDGTVKNLETSSVISDTDSTDSILYSSRHCDTVLVTAPHSTFGWWLGYLSKGNQVYYTDLKFVNDLSFPAENFNPDDYYPPHWTPVRYGGPANATVIEIFLLNNWRKKEESTILTTIQGIPSISPIVNNVTLPTINEPGPPKVNSTVPGSPKKYLSTNLAANARLGNHLFEMASLYGISKKLERIPTFYIQETQWHDTMLQDTDFLIPGLIDHFLIVNDTMELLKILKHHLSSRTLTRQTVYCILVDTVILYLSQLLISTFGWWLGYLSKGNQVYYTDLKFVNDRSFPAEKFNPDDYYPPHWTPVKYGGPGNAAVIESLK